MCARSVCVLVLCCVTSWAQRHPHFSHRFRHMPENPDFFPQEEFPPFDQFPDPDIPEQPVPYGTTPKVIIVQAPGFPDRPWLPNYQTTTEEITMEQTTTEYVRLAGLPTELKAFPLQLENSDHELQFNVSWVPSAEFPATAYSIEVANLNKSEHCKSQICYRSDILQNDTWALIPKTVDTVHGGCSIHPGCTYLVKLTAHPGDGQRSANLKVSLKECEAGVCSCAHWEHLPVPIVSARTSADGTYTTISWVLPAPLRLQRLPLMLGKRRYTIELRKESPLRLFETIKTRYYEAYGLVLEGDTEHSINISIPQEIMFRTKLRAEIKLVDKRDCVGYPGIATVFDPEQIQRNDQKESKTNLSFGVYAILGALIGAWAMGAVFVLSARVVKRVLKSLRPAPVSAPLEALSRRPAWFPLQLRTNNEIPARGQMEESPLYVQKEFEIDEEGGDEWEVSRSRVHLGSLIGSGAFGRVHAAQLDMPGGETITVAAKMLTEDVSEEEVQDFLREIVMLKHVGSHKHVIRLVACCTRRAPLIALLEHAPRGDLLSLLRAARGRRKESQVSSVTKRVDSSQGRPSEADSEYTNLSDSDPGLSDGDCKLYPDSDKKRDHYVAEPALQLDGSTMREYALQVALGMRHLEERGITHRDLAARNILVDGAGLLKVADFGLSRSGVYVHTRSRPVPLRWLAPEAILHSQYCSASDVWAFAVLLWEIATLGGFPYAELSNHHVPSFLAGGGRLPKPARASPRLYELMVECWSENPSDRPTFSQIVDKLTVQKQLYVDLDCVFPPSEDEVQGLRDYDFNMTEPNGLLDR